MNRRTRKIEVTFYLTFDDHYIKKDEHIFSQNSFFPENQLDSIPLLTIDIEINLIFGELKHATSS